MKNFLQKTVTACFTIALCFGAKSAQAQVVKIELTNNFLSASLLGLNLSVAPELLDKSCDWSGTYCEYGLKLTQTKYMLLPTGQIQTTYHGTLPAPYTPAQRTVAPVSYTNVVGADQYLFEGDAVLKSDGTLTLKLTASLIGASPY